jgi:hypothetical protein
MSLHLQSNPPGSLPFFQGDIRMHVKLAISKLLASSIAALLLIAAATPTVAAPNGATPQQTQPDCKKDPTDPRCSKD